MTFYTIFIYNGHIVVQIFFWFKIFSIQFDFYLPLSHIIVMNTVQRKIRIKQV